jgi:hypothetical protein
VIGYVTPELTGFLNEYVDVKYYLQENFYYDYEFSEEERAEEFYGNIEEGDDVKYTKIEIKAPSKYLTEDLYMSAQAPFHAIYAASIAQYSTVLWFVMFFTASLFASWVAGLIIFKDMRSKWGVKSLTITGLFNILTIIVVLLSAMFMRTKNVSEEAAAVIEEARKKGYVWKRRLGVVFSLLILPLMLYVSGVGIFMLDQVWELFFNSYTYWTFSDLIGTGIVLVVGKLVFMGVVIVTALLMRAKKEDISLFERAKALNIGVLVFQPKDGKKLLFVGVFSVLFLFFSWGLVELLKLTL